MIVVIPVLLVGIAYVGTEYHELPAGLQNAAHFRQNGVARRLVRQMLEEIRGEYPIETVIFDMREVVGRRQLEADIGSEKGWRVRIEIDPVFSRRRDVVDELAIAACQVEHG